jgi:cation diffusion facilitator CzcD-associated flavoprotein CzcO
MRSSVDVLIIGAGPFGLATAAALADLGVDHLIVGEPISFWRDHMPRGMLLRSGPDWHLDPAGHYTMERFLAEQRPSIPEGEPLDRDLYLSYAAWFQRHRGIDPLPVFIDRLDRGPDGYFIATLKDGVAITARRVILALGMGSFAHVPEDLTALVPTGLAGHTSEVVEFRRFKGRGVMILGGRQSAYEWAALLGEAGASEVHVIHRHPSPAFQEADWTWVAPLVEGMVTDPGWYRRLPTKDQASLGCRLWPEGRLKVEPWLEPRVRREGIEVWPETTIAECRERPSGELAVSLESGVSLTVDDVIFATGYKVDVTRIPLLATRGFRRRCLGST